MPDDNNTQTPNLSDLTNKIAELSSQLEQAKTALTERDNKIKALEGDAGTFKTANGQLTSKVTDLETQLQTAQQTITAQTGELTNWTTKFDQLNQAHTTLTGDAATSKQQLQLYGLIAGDAKYHGLIGVVDAIKTDGDPAKQKEILDKMAGGLQSQTNQTLDAFRSGATNTAGHTGGSQPGGSLPTDAKQAFEEYQNLLSQSTPEALSRRAALYEVIVASQFGEGGKQQN
jgi:hypothetical protein